MSFARLDDGFTGHPKVLALGSAQRRWTWLEVIVYTCRYGSPVLPGSLRNQIPHATERFLRDCEAIGLIDRDENGARIVHDWYLYNGSIEARVEHYLAEHPEASANEVQSAIHGKREVVLAVVKKLRGVVPGNRESGSHGTGKVVPEVVPTASAPAKGVESKKRSLPPTPRPRDPIWDTLVDLIGASPAGLERGRWNAAVKSLKESGATPELLRKAAENYRTHPTYADCAMTVTALASNWTTLTANGKNPAELRLTDYAAERERRWAENGDHP